MITQEVAKEWAQLTQFRAGVYNTFQRRADAVFELVDALASDTQARSPVELSPSPFFRRQYASIYGGLDEWKYDAVALDEVLLGTLPPLGEDSFRLWAVDETPRPRRYAPSVADRGFVHYPNPVGNNKPITIGHNYAALVHVDLAGPSTWAPPWALERTPTNWTGVDLALEQIVHLVRCDDEWHVVAADSRYGTPSYIAGLHQCPNVTGVTRLRRPVIEHFNRFIEQRLLFESAFNDFSANQVQFALFRLSKLQQTVSCLLSTACPIGSRTVR